MSPDAFYSGVKFAFGFWRRAQKLNSLSRTFFRGWGVALDFKFGVG